MKFHPDQRAIGWLLVLMFLVSNLAPPANAQKSSPAHHSKYRGFSYDDTDFLQDPNLETIRANVNKEIDILFMLGLTKETLAAFRTEPIKLGPNGPSGHYTNKQIVINAVGTKLQDEVDDEKPGSRNLLHEFMHFFGHKLCSREEQEAIRHYYEDAKAKQLFKPHSYLMKNAGEFWAVAGCTYLYGTAGRPPYSRENIKTKMPEFFEFMKKKFGDQAGTYNGVQFPDNKKDE